MKKKVRGFTLIECLIALLILAVSSLLLTQAYSQLVRVSLITTNRNNNTHLQSKIAADPAAYVSTSKVFKLQEDYSVSVTCKFPGTSGLSDKSYTMKSNSYAVKPFDATDTQMSSVGEVNNGTDTSFVVITPSD